MAMDGMGITYYRAMKRDDDAKPRIGRSRRTLGVKLDDDDADIPIQAGGWVLPNTGGMSVAVDDPRELPFHRRPPSLKGCGRDPVFALDGPLLPATLNARVERFPHALIEPQERVVLDDYETALESTREQWHLTNEVQR